MPGLGNITIHKHSPCIWEPRGEDHTEKLSGPGCVPHPRGRSLGYGAYEGVNPSGMETDLKVQGGWGRKGKGPALGESRSDRLLRTRQSKAGNSRAKRLQSDKAGQQRPHIRNDFSCCKMLSVVINSSQAACLQTCMREQNLHSGVPRGISGCQKECLSM